MKYTFFIFTVLLLFSCNIPSKPDFVKDGKEYEFNTVCIKSHNEVRYDKRMVYVGKMFMPMTYKHTVSVCDSIKIDTIEINIENKFYKNK